MRTHLKILRVLFYIEAGLAAVTYLLLASLFTLQALHLNGSRHGVGPVDWYLLTVLTVLYGCMITLDIRTARNVGRATRWKLCLWTAIPNLIPLFSGFYFTGLPVGIYALIVLCGKEGRLVFQRVADGIPLQEVLEDRQREKRENRLQDADELDIGSGWDEASTVKSAPPPPADSRNP